MPATDLQGEAESGRMSTDTPEDLTVTVVLSSYLPPSFSNILLEKYENKIVTVYCEKSGDRNRIYGFLFHPGALQFF